MRADPGIPLPKAKHENVLEGLWWAAMAYAVGLLIFRLIQIFGGDQIVI